MTRSPSFTLKTSVPTATTWPPPSLPPMAGNGGFKGYVPTYVKYTWHVHSTCACIADLRVLFIHEKLGQISWSEYDYLHCTMSRAVCVCPWMVSVQGHFLFSLSYMLSNYQHTSHTHQVILLHADQPVQKNTCAWSCAVPHWLDVFVLSVRQFVRSRFDVGYHTVWPGIAI